MRDYKPDKQRKADGMQPNIEWPQKGSRVALPPKCKPREFTVKFTLHVEIDDGEVTKADDNAHDSSYSRRLPPPEDDQYSDGGAAYEIRRTDPDWQQCGYEYAP